MKKSGFTLIELLAVIVILAVIALIATPMIMDVIEKSRKGAAIESVNGILDTAEKYQLESMLEGIDYPTTIDLTSDVLTYKGAKPESGTLIIDDNNKMHILAKYGKYCIEKDFQDSAPKVVEDSVCENGIQIIYKESLLNGADPVLKEGLIPITIDNNGIVRKADISQEWYNYNNKEWANAVILKDESTVYHNEEVIPEENIESYFVWIPKYSYQLWDLGNYDSLTEKDASKVHSIPIRFGVGNTSDAKEGECTTPGVSGESGNCEVGDYMTHPAFLAFDTNGLWVGKFETGYEGATATEEIPVNEADATKVIIKPNVYRWKSIDLKNAFQTSYEYKRELQSHLMKNTEWGAVVYLSHSQYGSNTSISKNDNRDLTGIGVGNAYNTEQGVLASTTRNITGIYDMSGGGTERMAAYIENHYGESGFDAESIQIYGSEYFDIYQWDGKGDCSFYNRILGDATGELGPFVLQKATSVSSDRHNSSWYDSAASFINAVDDSSIWVWLSRGDVYSGYGGIFNFINYTGSATTDGRSYALRIVIV